MVKDFIDIKTLTLAELNGVVGLYPWYSVARKELCARMSSMGGVWDREKYAEAALYVPERRIIADLIGTGKANDYSDGQAVKEILRPEPARQEPERKVYVVGGDYFSQADYDSVRGEEDKFTFAFKSSDAEAPAPEEDGDLYDFCTESLAEIYLDQGYPQEAREIYSKLILRYPEKSAYFAGLIEKIDNKI